MGAAPALEVVANEGTITILDHETQERTVRKEQDPLETVISISRRWKPVPINGLPKVFTGGWSGYCGYDTVRYVYAGKKISLFQNRSIICQNDSGDNFISKLQHSAQ